MSDLGREPSAGLRERKKLRTRVVLVDAAVELCLKQGYVQTTVEQIAASADVSPRTFSRYFPSKEAVFLTLVEDYIHHLAVELKAIPLEVGPLEAMRQAHVGVLLRITDRAAGRLSSDRYILMLRVINGSEKLKRGSVEFRRDLTESVLADRMGTDVDDPRVQLVSVISATTILAACGDLRADTETDQLEPSAMVHRLNEAYGHVAAMSADLASSSAGADYEPVYG